MRYSPVAKYYVLLASFFAFAKHSISQHTDYENGMPSSKEVLAKFNGNDEAALCAKRIGALKILFYMIRGSQVVPYHNKETSKETGLIRDYDQAIGKLQRDCPANIKSLQDEKELIVWKEKINQFENDEELKTQIVDELFAAATREQYYKQQTILHRQDSLRRVVNAKKDEEYNRVVQAQVTRGDEKSRKRKMAKIYGILALVLIVAHYVIKFKLRGRQFDRTNAYGTQEFKDKKAFFSNTLTEGLANVLANIFLFAGLILFVVCVYDYVMSR